MGKASRSAGGGDDTKHEQALQAILLADDFSRSFHPASLETPSILMPLNNVILLESALEFLAGAAVKELVVFCTSPVVENYLEEKENNRYNSSSSRRFDKITIVCDSSCTNAGDALRELDKRNAIESDPFVLMHGNVLTNVDLQPAIAAHKERHHKDNSAVMTMLFKEVGDGPMDRHTGIRPFSQDLIVGWDDRDGQILMYDDRPSEKTSSLPCSFFSEHAQIQVRGDLLDCGVDICSPEVLARVSDEFDYRDVRKQFVANCVAEEEVGLQNKIYAHLLGKTEYAARICDFRTYHAVSEDLLKRWCYPVVPDNLPSGYERSYRYIANNQYLYREMKSSPKSQVGRTVKMRGPGMLGGACHLLEDCQVSRTVIGHGCHVGKGCNIKDSHLWDEVLVEEDVTVVQSILCFGCKIRKGAVINKGCIIGRGCIIGENVVLPEFTRITLRSDEQDDNDAFGDFDDEEEEDDEDEESPEEVTDHHVVGDDGLGRVWIPSEDDDNDDDINMSPTELMRAQSIGFDPSSLLQKRGETQTETGDALSDDEEEDDTSYDGFGDADAGGTFITGRQKGVDVIKELKGLCLEHDKSNPIENLSIELNSFKFSQNATYSDCAVGATQAILETAPIESGMTAAKLIHVLKDELDHWGPLLRKLCFGVTEEKAVLGALEVAALEETDVGKVLSKAPAFRFVLQTMNDEEILNEEAILAWSEERKGDDMESPRGQLFMQQPTQDFLEWLQEESEEEDDSSDDDDSE